LLKRDLKEVNKNLFEKVNYYENTIEEMTNTYKKERRDHIDKIKKIKNKYQELEVIKDEDEKRYEGIIANLNERIYKLEGKKYFYTNKFVNDLRAHEKNRNYSMEIINKIDAEIYGLFPVK